MNVWLDDIRPMPEGFDKRAYSAKEAIALIDAGQVKLISLDHDLGITEVYGTGYDVACHIEAAAFMAKIPRLEWRIHTQNTVGAKNMKMALDSADNHWMKLESMNRKATRKRNRNRNYGR